MSDSDEVIKSLIDEERSKKIENRPKTPKRINRRKLNIKLASNKKKKTDDTGLLCDGIKLMTVGKKSDKSYTTRKIIGKHIDKCDK